MVSTFIFSSNSNFEFLSDKEHFESSEINEIRLDGILIEEDWDEVVDNELFFVIDNVYEFMDFLEVVVLLEEESSWSFSSSSSFLLLSDNEDVLETDEVWVDKDGVGICVVVIVDGREEDWGLFSFCGIKVKFEVEVVVAVLSGGLVFNIENLETSIGVEWRIVEVEESWLSFNFSISDVALDKERERESWEFLRLELNVFISNTDSLELVWREDNDEEEDEFGMIGDKLEVDEEGVEEWFWNCCDLERVKGRTGREGFKVEDEDTMEGAVCFEQARVAEDEVETADFVDFIDVDFMGFAFAFWGKEDVLTVVVMMEVDGLLVGFVGKGFVVSEIEVEAEAVEMECGAGSGGGDGGGIPAIKDGGMERVESMVDEI